MSNMSDRPVLFCKDCKHFRKKFLLPRNLGRCALVSRSDEDYLVDGKEPERGFASIARKFGPCGAEGKLWEAKA